MLSLLQSTKPDWFSAIKTIFSNIAANYYLPDIYKSYIRNLLEHISSFFISQCHFQVPQQVCEDIDYNKIIIAQTAAEVEEYALYYLSLLKKQAQSLEYSPEIYSAQKYIKENLHKKITLSEIAQYVNVSESYSSLSALSVRVLFLCVFSASPRLRQILAVPLSLLLYFFTLTFAIG